MEITSDIMDVPAKLEEFILASKTTPKAQAKASGGTTDQGYKQGERNEKVFRRACKYRAQGLDYHDAKKLIIDIATNCTPPFPEAEAIKCLDSGWNYSTSAPFTDVGNVTRLKFLIGDTAKYAWDERSWWVWNGPIWEEDAHYVTNAAKEVSVLLQIEERNCKQDGIRKEIKAHAKYSGSARAIKAMVELAKSDPDLICSSEDFDTDDYLLTVKNGTIDLRAGELREHRPDDLITKRVDVEYDEEALCPRWDHFLEIVFANNDELIGYYQRSVGYSLTGSIEEQCLFYKYGSGANGKSTADNAIKPIMGDHAQVLPPGALMERYHRESHAIVKLRGARMAIASETGHNHSLDETLVKQLTGGDTITARQLYKPYIEFPAKFKLWISGNYPPGIKGSDHAIWRRIKIIPFSVTIPKEEQDPKLPGKLGAELPGILNWAIREGVCSGRKWVSWSLRTCYRQLIITMRILTQCIGGLRNAVQLIAMM